EAVESLASTSASFLVEKTPLNSSHHLPTYVPSPVTPTRKRKHELLDEEPKNDKEHAYQTALHESYSREAQYKSALFGMQSTVILQSMYCDRVSEQLAAQEESQRKKKKGQLNGDGLPRLLTGDQFYECVVEHQKNTEEEKIVQKNRRKQREEQARLMTAWKEVDEEQKRRNKARREVY
ncbi:hypothetical protein PAXRUDRAFT_46480, partial [Paxillus rubicundulus Ve08.2h10]